MGSEIPGIDPQALTVLAAGMAQMHEVYESAIAAGFTERQAFAIVMEMLRSGTAK